MIYYCSDLHLNFNLNLNLSDNDIFIIAGDFADIRSNIKTITQLELIDQFFINLSKLKGTKIISSGNHDFALDLDFNNDIYSHSLKDILKYTPFWLEYYRKYNFITDFQYYQNKDVFISVLPFYPCRLDRTTTYQYFKEILTPQIKLINNRKWIIVHHVPPSNTLLSRFNTKDLGLESFRDIIEEYQPTYTISGHYHECSVNYDKIGQTICLHSTNSIKYINI